MIAGFISAGIVLFLCAGGLMRRYVSARAVRFFNLALLPCWLLLTAATVVHMLLTLPLFSQRPVVIYILGFVMLAAELCALPALFLRKKALAAAYLVRFVTLFVGILMVFHALFGILSFQSYQADVSELTVSDVALSALSDGEYTGECDVGYIYARTAVTVKDGKIAEIILLEHRNERGATAEAMPERIVGAQSITVDAVTGATNSSTVIQKAVENALTHPLLVISDTP